MLDRISEEYVKNANVRSWFVNIEAIDVLLQDSQRLKKEIEKAKNVKEAPNIFYGANIDKNMNLIVWEIYDLITKYENDSKIKQVYELARKNNDKKGIEFYKGIFEGTLEERIVSASGDKIDEVYHE